jgi:hypothetical protein
MVFSGFQIWAYLEGGSRFPNCLEDALVTILYQENDFAPKQTPANSNIRTPIMLSWRSRDAAPQRRRPARRRPAWRGRVDAERWTPTITHMACAERVACVVRAAASTLEQACAARVPCAERVPCAVRATVAPAARCRSICCELPYWMPLVDAVLNVVV